MTSTSPTRFPRVRVRAVLGGLLGYTFVATAGEHRARGWATTHNRATFAAYRAVTTREQIFHAS